MGVVECSCERRLSFMGVVKCSCERRLSFIGVVDCSCVRARVAVPCICSLFFLSD